MRIATQPLSKHPLRGHPLSTLADLTTRGQIGPPSHTSASAHALRAASAAEGSCLACLLSVLVQWALGEGELSQTEQEGRSARAQGA
jgi:hypothetical protein